MIDSPYGTLIKEELIPEIAYMRKTYPLTVKHFFSSSFLENFRVNPVIDCTDLTSTDIFFDSIYLYKLAFLILSFIITLPYWTIFSDFIRIRHWDSWAPCSSLIEAPSYILNSLPTPTSLSAPASDSVHPSSSTSVSLQPLNSLNSCEIMLPLVPIKGTVSMMFLTGRRSRFLIRLSPTWKNILKRQKCPEWFYEPNAKGSEWFSAVLPDVHTFWCFEDLSDLMKIWLRYAQIECSWVCLGCITKTGVSLGKRTVYAPNKNVDKTEWRLNFMW